MNRDQVQLIASDYAVACDVFQCGERPTVLVGRPDAPSNTNYALCTTHSEQLILSVLESSKLKLAEKNPDEVTIAVGEYEELLALKELLVNAKSSETDEGLISLEEAKSALLVTTPDDETPVEPPNDTVSRINQSDSSITIDAKQIDLQGETTVEPPTEPTTQDDEIPGEPELAYDLETILENANTHAELDALIVELGLTDVLAREDEAGKNTLVVRKESLLKAADEQLEEVTE